MLTSVRLFILACSASALSFAGTWSGTLVDSHCYHAEQRNVNPTDTETYVDRDMNAEIRYCSPNAKTKSFAVVEPSGESFNLDASGNARAAGLVPKTGKRSRLYVTVTGEMSKDTVKVDSIQPVKVQ